MNLLPTPSVAATAFHDLADLFAKSLPAATHHRHCQLAVGDVPLAAVDSSAAVVAPAVVASTAVAAFTIVTVAPTSDLVPTLSALPIVLDAGASFAIRPFISDCLPAVSSISNSKVAPTPSDSFSKVVSIDLHALITGGGRLS